ncbi:MAG TPA: 4a-hydroxytetrahydrobiopterin dehydratase [Bacteroidales bacterium]|nr:4a-hydroxytetrahydrobiopterin dehydratase [Bacteroidales bacterium]
MELNEMHCKPLPKGTLPLVEGEIDDYLNRLSAGWTVVEGKILRREFMFEDFNRGVVFINDIAPIAEAENHHPDIGLHFNSVEVEFSTHSIDGLSVNDFIMASKVDQI